MRDNTIPMVFLGLILGLVVGLTFNVHEIKKTVEQCSGHSAAGDGK